jgi:hypothetical protein
MNIPTLPAVLLASAFAVAGPAPVAADTTDPVPGTEALGPPPSDRELVDFVSAFVRLIGVQHGYMMLLQEEPDPDTANDLKEQAVADMEAAIQQDGMTVDRYNSIALAVREDPELQGRVEGIIEQMAAESPGEPSIEQ